jgi:hypothetical protein
MFVTCYLDVFSASSTNHRELLASPALQSDVQRQ